MRKLIFQYPKIAKYFLIFQIYFSISITLYFDIIPGLSALLRLLICTIENPRTSESLSSIMS
jgi:hypothetical protein